MCSNAVFTVDVPAPDEPVTAMTGWLSDMAVFLLPGSRFSESGG